MKIEDIYNLHGQELNAIVEQQLMLHEGYTWKRMHPKVSVKKLYAPIEDGGYPLIGDEIIAVETSGIFYAGHQLEWDAAGKLYEKLCRKGGEEFAFALSEALQIMPEALTTHQTSFLLMNNTPLSPGRICWAYLIFLIKTNQWIS